VLEDPEVDARTRPPFDDDPCGTIEEESSNTVSLNGMGDVQIVDECAPDRIGVERHVGEPDRAILMLREHGEVLVVATVHAFGPDG
jgi:hypothetical protein